MAANNSGMDEVNSPSMLHSVYSVLSHIFLVLYDEPRTSPYLAARHWWKWQHRFCVLPQHYPFFFLLDFLMMAIDVVGPIRATQISRSSAKGSIIHSWRKLQRKSMSFPITIPLVFDPFSLLFTFEIFSVKQYITQF